MLRFKLEPREGTRWMAERLRCLVDGKVIIIIINHGVGYHICETLIRT